MTVAEGKRWDQIKGSIADAIRGRVDCIKGHVDELQAHLATCSDCDTTAAPYRLCGTGNRLLNAVLEA